MNIKLTKLLKHSKIVKSLGNIPKPNGKFYKNYTLLLEFTSFLPQDTPIRERLWYVEHNTNEIYKCTTCDNKAYWQSRGINKNTYNKYCSKCAKKSPEAKTKYKTTMLEQYGVEHNWASTEIRNRCKQTKLERYGSENYNNRKKAISTNLKIYGSTGFANNELLKKVKATKLERYGSENYNNMEQIKKTKLERYGSENYNNRKKAITTNINKYQVKHPLMSNIISTKAKNTKIEKYGNENYVNPKQISKSHKTKTYKDKEQLAQKLGLTLITTKQEFINHKNIQITYKCNTCDSIRKSYYPYFRCLTCNPYTSSISENEIVDYLKSIYDGEIITNSRQLIKPLEVDIYIPEFNLGIEYNGLFWHSELAGKDKSYHLNKNNSCKIQGITLVQISENEWVIPKKQEISKSMLTNIVGKSKKISAQKCEVHEVSTQLCHTFQEKNHIQGKTNSQICIGLYYDDELVSIMVFNKPQHDNDWELINYCNKTFTSIIGGALKSFEYFKQKYGGKVVTYVDLGKSTGKLYKELGFKQIRISPPNCLYFKLPDLSLYTYNEFQKHTLDIFDDNKTEWENIQINGWNRIYDCGNLIFEIELPQIHQ